VRVALGLKAHSGWAALVAIGFCAGEFHLIDRRRIELGKNQDIEWPGQPYHAAEYEPEAQARAIVKRGIAQARRAALKELRAVVKQARAAEHDIVACAVLMPAAMPDWSIEEILAVHFRMHKAEGVLFPDALAKAAIACGLSLVAIPEKQLQAAAEEALPMPPGSAAKKISALGKSAGAPWGADQKNAALAAMIALALRDAGSQDRSHGLRTL